MEDLGCNYHVLHKKIEFLFSYVRVKTFQCLIFCLKLDETLKTNGISLLLID